MTLVNAETGEIVRLPVHATRYSGLVHPAADRYQRMKEDRLGELAVDIAEHGLREPIWIDIDGMLLDGRNRLAACQMVGVEPEFAVYEGHDIEAFIISKNEHRRHLSVKEQRELRLRRIAELREQGMSTSAIAEEVGVSHVQVVRDLQPASPTPERVDGKDGKSYPTSRREWSKADALRFIEAYEQATPAGKPLIAQGCGLSAKSLQSTVGYLRKKFGIASRMDISAERRERIRQLASTSMTSDQIAKDVGLNESTVRDYAREMGVTIQGDVVMFQRRRIESNDVMQRIVSGSEISESTIGLVEFDALDRERIDEWVSSLDASISSLKAIRNRLKGLTR